MDIFIDFFDVLGRRLISVIVNHVPGSLCLRSVNK